jgi:hypothetical protein
LSSTYRVRSGQAFENSVSRQQRLLKRATAAKRQLGSAELLKYYFAFSITGISASLSARSLQV